MILVRTTIGPSSISGIGLFAAEFIAKGTPVWRYMPGFDIAVDPSELDQLSPASREQFLKYAYLNPARNKYILCFDDARFYNHSETPNCIEVPDPPEGMNIAARDIQAGEELTCDYRVFDADISQKL